MVRSGTEEKDLDAALELSQLSSNAFDDQLSRSPSCVLNDGTDNLALRLDKSR